MLYCFDFVLECFIWVGFICKMLKCVFFVILVEYFGYVVLCEGFWMDFKKVEVVLKIDFI